MTTKMDGEIHDLQAKNLLLEEKIQDLESETKNDKIGRTIHTTNAINGIRCNLQPGPQCQNPQFDNEVWAAL